MAMMNTIHPLDFVRIKERLAATNTRDPLKTRQDILQASVVKELVSTYLPQLAGPAQVAAPQEFEVSGPAPFVPRTRPK